MSAPLEPGTLINGIALRDVSVKAAPGQRFAAGGVLVYPGGWQPVVARTSWLLEHTDGPPVLRVISARVTAEDTFANWISAAVAAERIAAACNAAVIEPPVGRNP